MSQTALIYLHGVPGSEPLPERTVLFQSAPGEPVEGLGLEQAFARADGAVLHLVLGAAFANLTHVSISRKQARHLQRVLPFLLEEQLLDAPDNLWFASRKGDQDEYLVTVTDRLLVEELVSLARDAGADLVSLQVDVERLGALLPAVFEFDDGQALLAANRENALQVADDQREAMQSLFGEQLQDATVLAGNAALFDQLRDHRGQELLTGALAPRKASRAPGFLTPWKPLAYLAAAIFILTVAGLRVQQWRYQSAADAALVQAKQRYEQLFPGDKASSALNRQFQGRLNRLAAGGSAEGGQDFFPLLVPVARVLKLIKVEPKRLQYDQRQNTLLLDVGAKDYSQLESLQNAINEQGAKASIANYRNGAKGVNARIMVEQPG
ncbi:type II secretion system protein GspL [Alcanivorax profundi]|uniref:type II secretion system protein GspL n=1 Tax=Alcanivorax profundi TaxID=2338368 RepID=UPI0032B1195D